VPAAATSEALRAIAAEALVAALPS